MRDWHVPGLAWAVVEAGALVASAGLGWADVARRRPAGPDTAFAIGSCTKAFTTTALAMLVEDGLLDWDRPVRDYLPGFQLMDAVATARVTPRDLACHRTGMPRHDAVWYKAGLPRAELVARLAHLDLTHDLRAAYQYNNLMYIAAGALVEAVSGQSWEAFVRRRILDPLGMTRTAFSPTGAAARGDVALPYALRSGRAERIPFMADGEDALSAAGWIHSSAAEMARWVSFQLSSGRAPGGEPVLDPARLAELHTPQVVAPDPAPTFAAFEEIGYPTYGLGWRVTTYRGRQMVSHGGAIDGYSSHISFLPRAGVGAVVLTNIDEQPCAQMALYALYDALLDLEPIDWNGRIRERTAVLKTLADAEAATARAERVATPGPSLAPDAVAGMYRHPGYGDVRVQSAIDALTLTHHQLEYVMTRLGPLTFELAHPLISEPRFARFALDASGRVSAVHVPFQPGAPEIVFARVD